VSAASLIEGSERTLAAISAPPDREGCCRRSASMRASTPLYVFLAVGLFLHSTPGHAQGDAGVLSINQQQPPGAVVQQPGVLPGAVAAGLPATAPVADGLVLPTAVPAGSNITSNLTNSALPAAATAPADSAALSPAAITALRQRLNITVTGEPQQAADLPGTAIAPDPTPWPPTPPGTCMGLSGAPACVQQPCSKQYGFTLAPHQPVPTW
jgi:hypothetical protein